MAVAQTLHVAEEQPDAQQPAADDDGVDTHAVATHYPDATPFDLTDLDGARLPTFLEAVAGEEDVEAPNGHADARLVHREDWLDDPDYGSDYGLLLVWPDETLMFVGSDPTASGPPWFAYTIDPLAPVPTPATAQEALDRLKPPAVRDVVHESGYVPQRQGEWWLRPTPIQPTGTTFQPGVASKPYGPSPLGSHVPREWGMSVSDQQFLTNARANAELPASVQSPPEVIEWAFRQITKEPSDLSWHDVRQWGGDILVRGTIRHRDHDHPVETVGDDWHLAETHDLEVYTADDIEGVHLDYYGG